MFVAIKPLTESIRVGPPIEHLPGDVLERWAQWPYRVRVALLHAEMAEERPDVVAPSAVGEAFTPEVSIETSIADALTVEDGPADMPTDGVFICELCDGRAFINGPALKRHTTRMHS